MRLFQRVTREVRLERIPGEVQTAIHQHLERYNLGDILVDEIISIETISVRLKKGLFNVLGPKKIISYAVLTPAWLVYAADDESGEVAVLSVKLENATVEDHALSPFFEKMPDRGYRITGNFTGQVGMHGQQQVTIFLGLGEERAATAFGETLEDAIAKTRR